MRVHPAIAALRGAPISQRRPRDDKAGLSDHDALQSARDAWLDAPLVRAISSGMARYGAGEPLADCPVLKDALHSLETARALTEPLFQSTLGALMRRPLGEAPFRFKVSRGLATIQLIEAGGATLSLAAYEPLEGGEAPDTALFSDREIHEIALAGEAVGAVYSRTDQSELSTQPLHWRAGDRLALRARYQARQVLHVKRSLLLLQLTREAARPAPTHLVALESGATLRTASGDKSASQAVMALGVLGALGEYSALGVMENTALNRAEDADVRWEAARQTLGLGPVRGLALLKRLANHPEDPLAAPASALRTRLLDAQPELQALVKEEPV